MNARTAACTALLALAALTSCSSGDSTAESSKPATTSPPASESTTAEPTPTEPEVLTLGDTWEFEGTDDAGEPVQGAVTVVGYKQDVKSVVSADEEFSTDGYVWAALELKTCSTQGSFWATTTPWTLAYEDGTRIEPSSTTYDDFPRPEFPFETKLTTDKCVKGHLVYPVPGDQRPATVVYAPDGLETPTEWTVPKA